MATRLEEVISLAKRRGFVVPCGEIYGGTRSAWDYGPLGVELKKNVKDRWWRAMVHARDDIEGLVVIVLALRAQHLQSLLHRQIWAAD